MPRDFTDPDDLVDRLFKTDARLRRLSRRIRKQQELLGQHLSPAGWQVYLELEALVNERAAHLVEQVAKHFRKQGRPT